MYQDSEIRAYYRKVIRKIRVSGKKCVTAEMTERIMDISGRKEADVPLAQAARINPDVIRRRVV